MEKKMSANARKASIIAERYTKVVDDTMEKVLFDAEELVKKHFPARYVSASLTKLRVILKENGISANFDKRISREDLRRTAAMKCTKDDCDEAVQKIAKAIIAETNMLLEKCDKAITAAVDKHCTTKRIAGRRVRMTIEANMRKTGLNFKFDK